VSDDDIVVRLRALAEAEWATPVSVSVAAMREAADEIERLRRHIDVLDPKVLP